MIDDSEYHWRLIAECADSPEGAPLSQRPFLRAALRAAGYTIDGENPGSILRAICQGAMRRRMVSSGEDD